MILIMILLTMLPKVLNIISFVTTIFSILPSASWAVTLLSPKNFDFRESYRAAVVEYKPFGDPWNDQPQQILQQNTAEYLRLISYVASEGADIVVFPEYGLTTLGVPSDRNASKEFLLHVPEIGVSPCDVSEGSVEIQQISCVSKAEQVYVVINLGEIRDCSGNECPSDNVFHYNTNVVFDRSGKIVAKYEKSHLYFEDAFDTPNKINLSTFTTDFGVVFGVFTCFDIIFTKPPITLVEQGVKNFVYPTAWVDELPFMMAVQTQSRWAFSTDAYLLASGYHFPENGQLGSGIYAGKNGPLKYTFDNESGTQALIADIPINPFSNLENSVNRTTMSVSTKKDSESQNPAHFYLREDLSNYTSVILDETVSFEEICTPKGFCCRVNYSLNSNTLKSNFRLMAFNGTRTVAAKTDSYDWQVCAIVRCLNETLSSCSENDFPVSQDSNFVWVEITANFTRQEVYPAAGFNAFTSDYKLVSDNFELYETMDNLITVTNTTNIANISFQSIAVIRKYDKY